MSRAEIASVEPEPDDRMQTDDMVWIPGGTFRMGSDHHYPEEAPSHRASVDGFWIDRTPVTNAQFRDFVRETGGDRASASTSWSRRCRRASR